MRVEDCELMKPNKGNISKTTKGKIQRNKKQTTEALCEETLLTQDYISGPSNLEHILTLSYLNTRE
jgi:hypothetical protein